MRCLQNSTGSSDEFSSFFIRYAMHATIPARNRESGFPSRHRRTHHFLTSYGSADNMTVTNVRQVIRMGKKTRDERISQKKKYAHNQSNRFFRGLYLGSMQQKGIFSTVLEWGKKVSLNRPFASRYLPFPTYSPSSVRLTERASVISGAVKLSFRYQRDATPRARIRAREVIWLSETQTLLSEYPKVVE